MLALAALAAVGCGRRARPLPRRELQSLAAKLAEQQLARDVALEQCRARIAAAQTEPAAPGAPELEARRIEILGRAKGEPVLFVRAPQRPADGELSESARTTARAVAKLPVLDRLRVVLQRHWHDYATLRGLLLREGYLFSEDPDEAAALVKSLELAKLFAEPAIWLERGHTRFRLERHDGRQPGYRFVDGPLAGTDAELLFGDRVGSDEAALDHPLHRDLRPLGAELGFDRARILRYGERTLLAELRFGGQWLRALLEASGSELRLGCLDAPAEVRRRVTAWQQADAPRRRALGKLHEAVTILVGEKLPFDRPRGVKDHLSDGKLRPLWLWAYRSGQFGFTHDHEGYLVYDDAGRPLPPEMCVDFVLDSYERAAGTWFEPRGHKPGRVVGALDFDSFGIGNRAGVLAFGKFAESKPELFEFRTIPEAERIPFGERSKFFAYLLEHADDFRPGDVVAIQGLKRDGNVHQHAILIEDTDPLTGFPCGLADQMKWPRRRTWEGIMGEAPRRSLLFHVHPKPELLLRLDPERKAAE